MWVLGSTLALHGLPPPNTTGCGPQTPNQKKVQENPSETDAELTVLLLLQRVAVLVPDDLRNGVPVPALTSGHLRREAKAESPCPAELSQFCLTFTYFPAPFTDLLRLLTVDRNAQVIDFDAGFLGGFCGEKQGDGNPATPHSAARPPLPTLKVTHCTHAAGSGAPGCGGVCPDIGTHARHGV